MKKKGFSTNKAYISKLQNGKIPAAGEDINRALAEVTKGDPVALIQEAYIEKAPLEIKSKFTERSTYDRIINYLIENPLEVNYVGPSEYFDENELEDQKKYINSPEYIATMTSQEKNDFFAALLNQMAEQHPDDYYDLIDIALEKDPDRRKYNNLYKLRSKNNMSIKEVANFLGISSKEYSAYEHASGKNDNLINKIFPLEYFHKLAALYEVDILELIGDFTGEFIETHENPTNDNTNDLYKLPVLGSIRAGQTIDRNENEDYTLVDPERIRDREAFALRVQGDSMSGDRIQDGDIVIVVKQEEVQPHEIAVVAISGEAATLKRVKPAGDMCMLIPSNPTMSPELVPCKDVKIIGKVIEVKFFLG
jgi:repressor LexA